MSGLDVSLGRCTELGGGGEPEQVRREDKDGEWESLVRVRTAGRSIVSKMVVEILKYSFSAWRGTAGFL